MKPTWLVIAVCASVLAGAGGGYVATQYSAAKPETNKVAVEATDLGGSDDSAINLDVQDKKIAGLQGDLNSLLLRLEKAERASAENAKLKGEIDDLEARIAEIKKAPAVVATDAAGNPVSANNGASPAPGTAEWDAAVAEAMEKKAAEDRAVRDAEREKRMADMMVQRNKTILDKLSTELSLTEVQKTNIDAILSDMNTKRGEVMQRGREAGDSGTEFDWRAEMKVVSDASLEAVKSELSSAQLSTFNELVGEDGSLDSLAGGWGGGRGGNRGGGGGRGN